MRYIADLHIHSPYSRATSKSSHLHGLAAWAAIKGIDVVGTGDFTHPQWLNHLVENLEEAEPGFYRLKNDDPEQYRDVIPDGLDPDVNRVRFVLTSEISSIYKRGGKVRKIHNILFAPDLESVRRINVALSAIGNLESDGRPILGLDSRDLLEILLQNAPQGFLVPAHIWTPWFSLFGSKSGFDRIEDCYGDLTDHIFALETGLSSDPDMNRTISALDTYSLISNSDCHSPGKLGREANIFSTDFDYFSMRDALKHPVGEDGRQRFAATVEFYPEEGKYHCDGHRKCKVCMEPQETREHKGICPECGRAMTVGVLYRVTELADRETPLYPHGSPAVHSLVPLPELLGELLQVGSASKKVMQTYAKLIQQFGSEFSILLEQEIDDLEHGSSSILAEAVKRVRTGKVIRQPGYDGEFGVIRVFDESERSRFSGQMNLFGATATKKAIKTRRRIKTMSSTKEPAKKSAQPKKKELNPEQLQVVESDARHIIVKAGPGTGKTHTLVQRLVRRTASGDTPCTVITFTNKAAKELQDRLRLHLGEKHTVQVSTLHGYCLKWLRKKSPQLKVAGPDIRQWLLQSIGVKGVEKQVKELDSEITDFLQNTPVFRQHIPEHLKSYFTLLDSENLVDIDAVVPEMVGVLSEQGTLAGEIRKSTGTLYIDEFQDLNHSQYEVVRLLAETSSVFAIGDPDQSIYGFRGSSPVWFYRFIEELQPQQYSLIRNYRSAVGIVAAANRLIRNNHSPGPFVESKAFADSPGEILLYKASSPKHEAVYVVRQIERIMGGTSHREIDRLQHFDTGSEVTLRDIAVLYRTSRQAAVLGTTLYDHGFPVQVVDIEPYYLKEPVQILYLWCLMAAGLADSTHLFNILKKGEGVAAAHLLEVEELLPKTVGDINSVLAKRVGNLSAPVGKKVNEILRLKEQVQKNAVKNSVTHSLMQLAKRYDLDSENEDLLRFVRLADNFGSALNDFAHHLLQLQDSVVYDQRAEAITLMTLHAAKGLEFKVVFIVGLEEGMLPIGFREGVTEESAAQHIEEERRLFYVGMTRAEKILYLSYVRNRKFGGHDAEQVPSRFIQELPAEYLVLLKDGMKQRKKTGKAKQLRLFE